MNYELAKKLKDAGFPQRQHVLSCYDNGCYEALGEACVPTLSELIEACGDDFGSLEALKSGEELIGKYVCRRISREPEGVMLIVVRESAATTPEEAVANLWLALND